jgi:hypothetical protein
MRRTPLFLSSLTLALILATLASWLALKSYGLGLEKAERVSKILAFGSVTAFAMYKLFSGFHLMNLSVTLESERVRQAQGSDYLAFSVKLSKGDRGTLILQEVYARISYDGEEFSATPVYSTERLNTGKLRQGTWEQSLRRPYLYLTPGEEITLGGWAQISEGRPCILEVVVAGKTPIYWRSGQWRSAKVCLPIIESVSEAKG